MQFACNAHTICDPELRPLGTGLYPVISIINHRSYAKLLDICLFIYYLYQIRAINRSLPSLFTFFLGIFSCVPNAVLIFDGRTAYVRALQPIGKNEEVRNCVLII
jgi:SET and MYND domain-containing protein